MIRSLLFAALLAAPAGADPPTGVVAAAGPAGVTHYAWVDLDDGDFVARTSMRSADGIGRVRTLSKRSTDAADVAVTVTRSGAAQFAWTRMDGADAAVVTRRRHPDGHLGRIRLVSEDGLDSAAPRLRAAGAGVRLEWTRLRDNATLTRRLSASGTLGPIKVLHAAAGF